MSVIQLPKPGHLDFALALATGFLTGRRSLNECLYWGRKPAHALRDLALAEGARPRRGVRATSTAFFRELADRPIRKDPANAVIKQHPIRHIPYIDSPSGQGKMMYLVTGGCGFIGSHLVDVLQQAGKDVRVLDNLSTGRRDNVAVGTEIVVGDVCDEQLVRRCMEGADGCFHLAAVASVEKGNQEWVATHRTNVTGAVCVFEAARRANPEKTIRVVYASSAAVLGDVSHIPASEDEPVNPLSAYGVDKYGCELHARVATRIHRVATVGLRFFNVYGPRQDPNSPYSGVISIFAQRLKEGSPLRIYGDGCQSRDFVYVGDVVRFLVAAMRPETPPGQVYNVCTGRPTEINALAAKMAEIAGVLPNVEYAPARSGDIAKSLGNPDRAARDLGLIALTPLTTGLRQTMDALATVS